jgi:hypothetical protein
MPNFRNEKRRSQELHLPERFTDQSRRPDHGNPGASTDNQPADAAEPAPAARREKKDPAPIQYDGLPREGVVSNFLLARSGDWAIRYVSGGDTYAAYVSPGTEKTLKIGQTVKIDWFQNEPYAKITILDVMSSEGVGHVGKWRRHAAE